MQIIRRQPQRQNPQQMPKRLSSKTSLTDFVKKRNKILIYRKYGGLGDILMHRMMFKGFKDCMPDAEIHFACPEYYHDAVRDHPYIDKLLNVKEIDISEYLVSYNTSSACNRVETRLSPNKAPHRSDIWAEHCGVKLEDHNMHFCLTENEKATGRAILDVFGQGKPRIVIAPVSAVKYKNLTEKTLLPLLKGIEERGLLAVPLHNGDIPFLDRINFPMIKENHIRKWIAIINAADMVISVDTAAFHCAGGLGKPTIGVFTYVNAETYGKYYQNVLSVQSPCPMGYSGCYNWGACPKFDKKALLPCTLGITAEMILEKVDIMLKQHMINAR